MNATTTLSTTKTTVAPIANPHYRKWLRLARILLGVLLLCTLSLAEPHVFRFVVRQLVSFEAYRRGWSVNIDEVDGSLWEPVSLSNARWSVPFQRGGVLRIETARVQGEFAWRELFKEAGGRCFSRLSVEGVRGNLNLPEYPLPTQGQQNEAQEDFEKSTPLRESGRRGMQLPIPARLDVKGVDLTVTANRDSVHFQNGSFILSEFEPGTVQFGQIVVRQPWLSRTFRDVKGTTALQDSREPQVVVADLALENGVKVTSLSAKIADIVNGRLNAAINIDAFGGTIRAAAKTLPNEKQVGIETSGKFSNIGVAQLATFLGVSDAAGGTIENGNFTFRGAIRDWTRAAMSLRLKAVNFQWESRQWDSLVFGAALLDQRLQIPELELHQGQNRLSLTGEMALPTRETIWWQRDFSFNIAAKIENLTELSALLLPEFRYAAGKMYIDGAVRGKDQQFNGALIVSGSGITWRNAPIEELHAALKITGNELQVANFELLNKDDFVRGRGVVNIVGAKQYWGELRASVADLATYAALLQPPIVPEPLAGGGVLNWSGEGSAKGHSGKFDAHLQKLRTIGATGARLHPVNADMEGVYGPGSIQFSNFSLSDDQSAFAAHVTVGNQALSLQNIRLTHGAETWLEGYALLPFDIWRAWPNTALPMVLTEGIPGSVNLTARNLQLGEASRLSGWKWPIEGIVNGTINAEGPIGSINAGGQLTIEKAQFPLGWNAEPLKEVTAKLSLTGQTLNVDEFKASHASGDYAASGQIDFKNVRDTTLNLTVSSNAATFDVFNGIVMVRSDYSSGATANNRVSTTARLNLQVAGLASAATISGKVDLVALRLPSEIGLDRLWKAVPFPSLPLLMQVQGSPWKAWTMNLAISADRAMIDNGGLTANLHLGGKWAAPTLTGELVVPQRIGNAKLIFRAENPAIPSVDATANGELYGSPFTAFAYGPLTNPIREFIAAPPLTPELISAALAGELLPPLGLESSDVPVKLTIPKPLHGDTEIYEWAPMPAQESPAEAQPEEVSGEAPTSTPSTESSAEPTPPIPTASNSPKPAESATPPAGTNQ